MGYGELGPAGQAESFFQAYLAAPVVILFYIVYKLWKRTSIVRAAEMDITSGVRELDLPRILAEERAEQASWPKWKKVYKLFC